MEKTPLIESALNIIIQAINSCLGWFTSILDAVEGGKFYIAMVFIAMACGFLLSNFKAAMSIGSDTADNAASAYVRREKRPYRLGNDRKIH